MSVDDVIADVEARGCPTVEVTGGEPLLQPDVYPLMQRLLDSGKRDDRTAATVALRSPPGVIASSSEMSGIGGIRQERLEQSRASHQARRSEIRDRRSMRLRVRSRPDARGESARARQCGVVFAGARRAASKAAIGMGNRRSSRCPRAVAGPQVHLEPGDAWSLGHRLRHRLVTEQCRELSSSSAAASTLTQRRRSPSATGSRCVRSASTMGSGTYASSTPRVPSRKRWASNSISSGSRLTKTAVRR